MSLKTKIISAVEDRIIKSIANVKIFGEYYKRTDRKAEWKRQATTYQKKEIKDWQMAIITATDPDNPRRGELMRFYESLKLDLHLSSCIDNRVLPIQCAPFKLVDQSGNEDEEVKKLLDRPWYLELVRLVCEHTFEGTKLIEMFEVDDEGELKDVTEIPQANFIAQKGIIVNEEWDEVGTSYKEGKLKDYYIQVGGDWNLGLFSQLAMVVLAKKLGLGSWMSYIDKFGVPPLFAITERMDQGRIDELFEMLENFRMNHFAVLQGNEKIEVPNNYNVDAYNSFKSLADICDKWLSKRILGGSGISDEKSFVGSVEAQERLLQFRHQVDKLMFKFYFNKEVKPRLVKLSSVYAPLANLTFEYDESESLTLKEILEAVKELSSFYEFDVEELVKITGLPLVKIKEAIDSGTNTNKKDPEKKINAKLNYLGAEVPMPQIPTALHIYAATWDAAIDRVAERLYNGEIKPADLDTDLVLKNYAALNKATEAGWGSDYYESETTRKFRENLIKFSGSKSYNLMNSIKKLANEGLSKEEFKEAAKKRVQLHNETYLEVEKKFAANSASSARDFEQFIEDEDIYPNLKYRTMKDDDVRDAHRKNEGIVKSIKDWNVIPPLDPGCRCFLEQTVDDVTKGRELQNVDPKWANNPARSGKVFLDNHSYFEKLDKEDKDKVRANTERMKQFIPYNTVLKVNKNKIFINDFADKADLKQNKDIADKLAKNLNEDIYIRPHIEDGKGTKNPELAIGKANNIADLKTYKRKNVTDKEELMRFIDNSIDSSREQKASVLVIDISIFKGDIEEPIVRRLYGKFNKGKSSVINEVVVVKGNKVAKITRKQVEKKQFKEFFNNL